MSAVSNKKTTLRVIVHYSAAAQPFKDEAADPGETVGALKARVLIAFGLAEGPTGDGNQVNYTLYQHRTPLENLAQTLGELVDHQRVLQLKLAQQIIQG